MAIGLLFTCVSNFGAVSEDLLESKKQSPGLQLPVAVSDSDLQTPESFLKAKPGARHLRPDELVRYFEYLDHQTENAQLQTIGYSYEGRPLLNYVITSPENFSKLEEIKEKREALWNPNQTTPCLDDLPAVVYLGYSIHGNESSGSNAAPWVAYLLSAESSDWTREALEDLVVIIDPMMNPDGLARFAHWSNTRRGKVPVSDPDSWEHQEPWPSGRTNHYWFDLNRDWLPLQHPESRARVASFQNWRPNVLADFHEMGSNATYFFQPGVPARTHPLTPRSNIELTGKLATYHAEALDQYGALYFSQESYDDFYFGKGSTYPDVQGSVGILFEQASSRGLTQDTIHGELTFLKTIQNQLTTSFSTLRGAWEMRTDLLRHQREFFEESLALASANEKDGWIISAGADLTRLRQIVDIFLSHSIEVYETRNLSEEIVDEMPEGPSVWVPYHQPQYRLIQAMTEVRTEFEESVFYDVSAWNFLMSFGLNALEVDSWDESSTGSQISDSSSLTSKQNKKEIRESQQEVSGPAYGWALDWRDSSSPKALFQILNAGYVAYVATEPFAAKSTDGRYEGRAGTVVVLNRNAFPGARSITGVPDQPLPTFIAGLDFEISEPIALTSGFTPDGPDLGSATFKRLETPRIAMWVGSSVSAYSAGEIWKLLDFDYEIPVTLLEFNDLRSADWNRYNVMILPPGSYSGISDSVTDSLKNWVRDGGTLIAVQGGAKWAADQGILSVSFKQANEGSPAPKNSRRPYSERSLDQALKLVRGAIFMADLDLTHPVAFGYEQNWLPVFRNTTDLMQPSNDPYANVSMYVQENPLLSGYISEGNLRLLEGTANVIADKFGSGGVIFFADNPNFRTFWKGTQRMTLNAIFFGNAF